jgi:hypothetical protein
MTFPLGTYLSPSSLNPLKQVSSLKDTENVLAVVRAEVESLRASVQRVRNEIADPYKQIRLKTRQLAALHGTVELLRYVIRVLKLTGKLREQLEGKSGRLDLAKGAQLYSEIDGIRKEADLEGVEAVEAEMGWLSEVGQRIRTEAMKSLEAGMESLNQVGCLASGIDLAGSRLLSCVRCQAERARWSSL